MDPNRQRRVLEIFETLLELPPEQRAGALPSACAGDELLQGEVGRLLAMDQAAAQMLPTAPPERRQKVEQLIAPPLRVGPFRIDGLLGRGGMGEVWRGVRDDGLFDQQVAIKMIWPGVLGEDARQWFDSERRLLARLQHPAVAQILDGGTDAMGRGYFVMELVEGLPVDRYFEQHGRHAGDIVRLMASICRGIEHAHRQLVVHADLKPSNIVITAEGRPKLLDFGIARLLDEDAPGHPTLATGSGAPLTRAYASPQRRSGALPSISDDLYSLGVILEELLTGVLRDHTAPSPASTGLAPDLRAVLERARHAELEHRYGSVAEFREDLERYLGHFPVQARAGGLGYRSWMFARRHRLGVSLATLATLALLVATIVMAVLYAQAEAARLESEQRFAEVRALAKYMLFDLDSRLESTPGTTEARREMTARSQQYLDALGQSAVGNAELAREVAQGLMRLAEVQGVPGRAHVGEPAAARANLERAEEMLASLLVAAPQSGGLQRDLGNARYLLALVYGGQDSDYPRQLAKAREAEVLLQQAAAAEDAATAGDAGQAQLQVLLLGARLTQADALSAQEDFAAAATLQAAEEARLLALPESQRLAMEFAFHSARPAVVLGDSLYYQGQLEQAVLAYQRAAARFESGLVAQPLHRRLLNGTVMANWSQAGTLDELGRYREALAAIDLALERSQSLRDIDPANFEAQRMHDIVRSQRAVTLGHLGRHAEAILVVEAGIAEREARARLAPEDAERARDPLVPLRTLAEMYRDKGDVAGACRVLRRAEVGWREYATRFSLSPRDQRTEVAVIEEALKRCADR